MDSTKARADRISLPSHATARLRGSQSTFTVDLNNLSITGALVFSPDLHPTLGDFVEVTIAFPNKDDVISLTGKVVRITKTETEDTIPGFAVTFGPAPDAAIEHIVGGDLFEFFFSTTTPSETQFCLKDVDGRPLGELNTPEGSRRGSNFDVRECPFPGTRFGKLMNVTGQSEITANWPSITADLLRLRRGYLHRIGATAMTVGDLWALSQTIATLPNYLLRCGKMEKQVPRRIAALFKSITGVTMTTKRMLERSVPHGTTVSPAELVRFTNDHHIFNNKDRTCSGPPDMVDELLEILISGKEAAPYEPPLESVIGDTNQFLSYGIASIVQHINGMLFKSLTLRTLSDFRTELAAFPSALRADPLLRVVKEAAGTALATAGVLTLSPGTAESFKAIAAKLASRLGLNCDYSALSPPPTGAPSLAPYASALQRLVAESHRDSSADVRSSVAAVAVRGVALEQASIHNFIATQEAIVRALGRGEGAIEIDSLDLSTAFRPTVRDTISRAAGVDALVDGGGVTIGPL